MKKTFLSKKILIIGASGTIGNYLFNSLRLAGARVNGTSRKINRNKENFLYLDFFNSKLFEKFPWRKYDLIINCAGSINYQNTLSAARENIFINALAPLYILSQLNKDQVYFHCSTQVVTLPLSQQNSYSLSKLFFENYVGLLEDIKAKVVILRIPGVFCENRKSGIIYLLKKHYQKRKPVVINWTAQNWHTMYLPRVIKIILSLIKNNCSEKLVIIGYPAKTTIEKVLAAAKKAFGFSLPVKLGARKTNHYIPDIFAQKKYIKVTARDFENDLINYFKR